MRQINEIIIHCSATVEGKNFHAKDIDQWHKQKGWKCIGYHYVIDLNGTVEIGRKISEIGSHCVGHNKNSIGICYVGGLDKNLKPKDTRTEEQKIALLNLLKDLLIQFPKAIIAGHNEFSKKACPSFDVKKEYYNINLKK